MNETQRRIKAYKAALPGLRERVIAVALLLAMSVAMMTSATFAWLTISQAPAVSGASTTVAANGNLEIALVNPEGEEPPESQIGDSSATNGQTVANANLTWGNLVNLSDPSYGLDNLVLRPAMLSSSQNLLSNPLVSVFYGQDGRAESNYNRDFAFTNWNAEREFFEFSPTPRYGVRAISTIEYKIQDSTLLEYRTLYGYAETANGKAGTEYRKIIGNDVPEGEKPENHNNNIKVIAKMLGAFISESVFGNTETMDCAEYVKDLYNMVVEFEGAYAAVGDSLAAMANVQVFSTYGINDYKAHLYDRNDLVLESNGKKVANTAQLKADGVTLDSLSYYVKDLNTLAYVKEGLYPFYLEVVEAEKNLQTAEILWPEIEDYVSELVVIGTCTVQVGENGTPLTPGQLVSNLGTALNILGSGQVIGTIKQGLIVNYEQLSGEKMNLQYVMVENSVKDIKVRYIRTTAKAPGRIQNDLEINCSMDNSGSNLEGSAQDTYGLAVDMWVRTNTDGVRLILEGNVLTEDTYEKATMTIPGGQTVDLYTATVTYPESEESEGEAGDGDDSGSLGDKVDEMLSNSETVDVYMLTRDVVDDAGNVTGTEDVWYFADTHAEVYKRNEDGSISTTPNRSKEESEAVSVSISTTQKMNTITNVIGYYGENRVWEDAKAWEDTSLLNVSSTTQGSGSCYVFYADNPTDQENSLKLLSNLRVAFLNENGKLVAKAKLDTMNHYATPGKVIVPLVLMIDSDVTSPTYTGDDLAIVALEKNEATRLTMVIYLDGTNLTNDQVLAANDIQGKLNVQFGSSVALNTIGDEVLETAELHVSASVKDGETEFDYDTHEGDMTTHVTVNVDGITPATVKAYFIRQVNATQGSREATPVVFEAKGNGVYEGAYTFTAPGTYILRSVELDGQEYELEGTYPKVTVKGFAMSSVVCSGCNPGEITSLLTGNNSISRAVSVSFLTDDRDKMPNSVQVQFLSNDGGDPVTVLMAYNATSGSFEGNAVFNKSGSYTMRYVIMDGDYVDLGNLDNEDTSDELITLDITLGVYVRIADEIDGDRFDYEGKSIAVPMLAQIYNGSDEILAGLQNVELHYAKEGTLQDAPDANMVWDADNQRYYGTIQLAKPGKYAFDYVLVGGNLITKTTGTPPSYTVISPDPVVYVKGTEDGAFTEDYQFMSSGTATMAVRLGYAESATVYAVMKNTSTGTEETVRYTSSAEKGTNTNGMPIREFVFNIPSTDQHGQDGTWVITEIQMADVCDDDQNYYDDTNRLVWTMAADDTDEISDTIQTKVQTLVFDIRRDANTTAQTTYQTKADGSTYAFMETTTGDKNAYFDFTDKLGNALDSSIVISDVKAVYTYMANTSETHGGYIADFLKANIDTTYNLTKTNATTYTLPANTVALNYAGEYNCTMVSYKVNGTEYGYYQGSVYGTVDADMPSYILKTAVPELKFTATRPIEGTSFKVAYSKNPGESDVKDMANDISDDGYSVTLYYTAKSDGCDCNGYDAPAATVTLSNIGENFDTATCTIETKGTANSVTYSFSRSRLSQEQTIGANGEDRVYLGTDAEATTLTVTYGEITYTVTLQNPLKATLEY